MKDPSPFLCHFLGAEEGSNIFSAVFFGDPGSRILKEISISFQPNGG